MLLVVATATFTGVKNEILLAAYVGTHVIHTRVYIRDHPSLPYLLTYTCIRVPTYYLERLVPMYLVLMYHLG